MQMLTRMVSVFVIVTLAVAVVVGVVTSQSFLRSVGHVTERLQALASEEQLAQHDVIAQTSMDEIGDLVQAYNRIQRQTETHIAQLRDSVLELENANARRQQLLETMVGLTAPVIPVAKGLVVVLLSGYFDQERARHIRPNLLEGIAHTRAQIAIIDLTAIAEVSTPLAEQLHCAVRSVMLMGCQVILTGASADVAWALTKAGGIRPKVQARRSLQDGLSYAYDRLALH
jgi:anti-anti-sigma regulatory factor